MATSVYDENLLNDDQKRQMAAFKAEWDRANAAGDQAAMDSAHRAAENLRAQAGYSGGADGGSYTALAQRSEADRQSGNTNYNSYTASQLPSYKPQVDQVNQLYDAAREAQLAQLKSAYDQNNATLESQRAAIPEAYQAQRNQTAAQSELAGRNFREYAAASGLNSGTGGQAELARSNQLQGNLSALGRQETAEQRDLESKIAQLKIQYQNDVSAAIAQGEYDRAAALMQEYQRAQESAVTTAQAQAAENYRAWQSGYQQNRDQISDAQYQQQLEEARRQADQSQANWQAQFDYGREQDQLSNEYADWERQLKMAQLAAEMGDYSLLQQLLYGNQPGASTQPVTGTVLPNGVTLNPNGTASLPPMGSQFDGRVPYSEVARTLGWDKSEEPAKATGSTGGGTGGSKSGTSGGGSGTSGGGTYTPSGQSAPQTGSSLLTPSTTPNGGTPTYDEIRRTVTGYLTQQNPEAASRYYGQYQGTLTPEQRAELGRLIPGSYGAGNSFDITNGALTSGSPAQTMYGLFMNTTMPYDEMLSRLSAAVNSGQISEQAGQYILDAIKPRG